MNQYNEKWSTSLVYVLKPLIAEITAILFFFLQVLPRVSALQIKLSILLQSLAGKGHYT